MKHLSAASAALFCSVVLLGILMSYPIASTQVTTPKHHCIIRDADFNLQWRHSVEKTLWLENYQRSKNGFQLIYTDLISFGAGTPSDYPVIFQKGGVIRMSVNQQIPEINWTVSRNMQGHILLKDKSWAIANRLPDYSLVQFRSTYTPLWKIWWLGECDEYTE
ncbi:hypothetical protein F991_01259 [Acinetobacter sp. CIP-A165]|uniref:DUF1850 domain-containing protein n=1 Tax=Acinetobacter sp. CIP-A165 TaxID=40373 RepID=UPI0002CE1F5F|nr:DUF1850 domain-containing protein [Acinetobacter sp. CIP-A165]ENU30916.1 hypothetical protein F991_01259 [Acinetobacter sp. CIP-A165]